jgi:hypothetical protein
MSVSPPESVPMGGASTWKAPLDAPVSSVMRSRQTRRAAKVQRCQSTLPLQASLQHLPLCMCLPSNPDCKSLPILTRHIPAKTCLFPSPCPPVSLWLSWHICPAAQWPIPDVDECASRASCPTGLCLNTEGSFTCSACESGYWVNEDGTACEGNPGEAVEGGAPREH